MYPFHKATVINHICILTIVYFFNFVVTSAISATLNNLHLSTLHTLAFLLLLSKLPSAPFPLKQLLLITCTLTIAYFWFSCNRCSSCPPWTATFTFHNHYLLDVAVQTSKCILSIRATVINHMHSYDCLFFLILL